MKDAVLDSATTEAAGFPKEYAYDWNPDTFWLPTSHAAHQYLTYDFQAVTAVDAFGIYIKNPATPTSGDFIVESCDDDASYAAVTGASILVSGFSAGTYVYVDDFTSQTSNRYFRLRCNSTLDELPYLAAVMFFRKRTITLSQLLPWNPTTQYYNTAVTMPGGRMLVQGNNSTASAIEPRRYGIANTDYTALANAFADSRGRLYPLVSDDGTNVRFCRFASDSLARNEVEYQYYQPTFTLNEIPYIPEGENF